MSDAPAFVTVCLLYKKTSRSGRTLYFGKWNKLRVYLFEVDDRKPKDCAPTFELAIRMEDWRASDGRPNGEQGE